MFGGREKWAGEGPVNSICPFLTISDYLQRVLFLKIHGSHECGLKLHYSESTSNPG